MATRFNPKSRTRYGQQPLPSGYEKSQGGVEFYLPPCGIEDVDVSLFELFDKEISPFCGGGDSTPLKKVPIIFAAGEKWSLLKRGRPLRDRNNTLLLPLITIMRTEISQTPSDDTTARGINQNVGEFIVRRRLDKKSDRDYQNLINKHLIKNQDNLAVPLGENAEFTTAREVGSLSVTDASRKGEFLSTNYAGNIFETIVVPTPQFYTAKYQVTVWTQYMQHANQIVEKIITSFLPQGQSWKLDTPKGYWFIATVEGGSYSMETNFDDMAQQERFIKYTFNIEVPAYFFVSQTPGSPVPIKRYLSSPVIKFESDAIMPSVQADEEKFESTPKSSYELNSDDLTLPLGTKPPSKIWPPSLGGKYQTIVIDEELISMAPGLLVKNTAPNGETTYRSIDFVQQETEGGLQILVTKVFPGDLVPK